MGVLVTAFSLYLQINGALIESEKTRVKSVVETTIGIAEMLDALKSAEAAARDL